MKRITMRQAILQLARENTVEKKSKKLTENVVSKQFWSIQPKKCHRIKKQSKTALDLWDLAHTIALALMYPKIVPS